MAAEPFSTPIGHVQGHVNVSSDGSLCVVPDADAYTGFVKPEGAMRIALKLMPRCETCQFFHERARWKITGGPTRRGVCRNQDSGVHEVPSDGSGFCNHHPALRKALR
jgi:hypothetical protein